MKSIKEFLGNTMKKEFEDYCKLNEIEDVEHFIKKCTKDGLTLDKYGVAPFLPKSQIQEVPVEKEIIIEKIVTKEVKDTQLIEELEKLKKELVEKNNTINEQKEELKKQEDVLEHFKQVTVNRRTKYMKTSNLTDPYLD